MKPDENASGSPNTIDNILDKWRGDMMNKGFGSPSSANEIDREAKAHLTALLLEARIDELEQLLHKNVCEIMCRWSEKCEVQGEDCPKIRNRIAALRKEQKT